MSSNKRNEIQFINKFVDAVTVRPFFEDLRRIKLTSARYAMPSVSHPPAAVTRAA